ncbi:MAG: HEAT repeat domain-containing protein [Candidatus Micrarchaeota archaeon]|nr:HEAT repeat domain-containing protein [Candidatus Micrarchaeota archaeon]
MTQDKKKTRQISLAETSEEKPDQIDSLVAKAFDSDPKVRLHVAQELGKIDDPRAVFALIELSSDKDEQVRTAAQRSLDNFKEEKDAIISLEKLLAERKESPQPSSSSKVSQLMAPTIEKLFSHYEPQKRESVKRKLLPSLQKLFGFSKQDLDPLQGLDHIAPEMKEEMAAKEEQKPQNAANFPLEKHQEPPLEEAEEQQQKEEFEQSKLFEIAYRIATTPGFGKADLKREQNRILSSFKKELSLAFKMAAAKAAQEGLASLSNLKPGMKNLSFAEMQVISVSDAPIASSKKKAYVKLRISDGQKEQALLVPQERASGISPQDKIILKNVWVDFLVESNEVVLVVKPKSKILVVK